MKDNDQIAQLFATVPYLRKLDSATLNEVAGAAFLRSYRAGNTVIQEGEESAGLFIVEAGHLKSVKISHAGREQVVRVVAPGEVFNAIGVLASETNPGTVIALEDARVWCIERQALLRLLDEHPTLAGVIIQFLALRVQQLMQQVEDLSLRNVEERLARLLVEAAEDGIVARKQWETQAEMAARLGTVTDVLNRSLRRLAENDLIAVEREKIRILNMADLKAIAGIEV